MVLLEALIYSIVAILIPSGYTLSFRLHDNSSYSRVYAILPLVNVLSSIISFTTVYWKRKRQRKQDHRTGGTKDVSGDADGLIMGATLLPSLVLAALLCRAFTQNNSELKYNTESAEVDSEHFFLWESIHSLYVGWIVLSGFMFASLNASYCIIISRLSSATYIRRLQYIFWILIHMGPLLLLDFFSPFQRHKWEEVIHDTTSYDLEQGRYRRSIIVCHGMAVLQCLVSIKYYTSRTAFYRSTSTQCQNKDSTDADKARSKPQSIIDLSFPSSSSMQAVFSIGEWYVVSTLIFFLLIDFVLRYVVLSPMIHTPIIDIPSYLVVSHSGLVGCILGCVIADNLSHHKKQQNVVTIVYKLVTIAVVALGCVEIALRQYIPSSIKNTPKYEQSYKSSHWNELSCVDFTRSTVCNATYPEESLFLLPFTHYAALFSFLQKIETRIPLCLKWIFTFLVTPEGTEVVPILSWSSANRCTNPTVIPAATSNIQHVSRIHKITRGWWLIYWAIALLMITPMAVALARRLQSSRQHQNHSNATDERKTTIRKRIVAARKFFHFVAVILFGPVTLYAPSMMALSYAVAVAVLLVLESLRLALSRGPSESKTDGTVSQHVGARNSAKEENGTVSRENTNKITLNDFYFAFLDEKDIGGKSGGLVITHIALICGCAVPLWIAAILKDDWYGAATLRQDEGVECMTYVLRSFLPFIGVLTLGVGDAFGAIFGTYLGRFKWPGSKRTLEGSVSMFLSMILIVAAMKMFVPYLEWGRCHNGCLLLGFALLLLTLLEASTLQIDNLCLPLFGATLLLILGVIPVVYLMSTKPSNYIPRSCDKMSASD